MYRDFSIGFLGYNRPFIGRELLVGKAKIVKK